jgi:RNA polymerase sigma-70 factor (ECF subfamily)
MIFRRDPLENVELLVPRVYAFVAFRLGPGPDAEDVTSECFERAVRYRHSYDAKRGEPLAWLIGIARRLVAEQRRAVELYEADVEPEGITDDFSEAALRSLAVRAAVAQLGPREQELIALRHGADMTAGQIGRVVGMSTHAVEVALGRAESRLRPVLERRLARW